MSLMNDRPILEGRGEAGEHNDREAVDKGLEPLLRYFQMEEL